MQSGWLVTSKTAAYQERICNAVKLFPHEELKVTEFEERRVCGARLTRGIWHCTAGTKREKLQRVRVREHLRKTTTTTTKNLFWINMLQKWRLEPIHTWYNNTTNRWIALKARSLAGTLVRCALIKGKMSASLNNICFFFSPQSLIVKMCSLCIAKEDVFFMFDQ